MALAVFADLEIAQVAEVAHFPWRKTVFVHGRVEMVARALGLIVAAVGVLVNVGTVLARGCSSYIQRDLHT